MAIFAFILGLIVTLIGVASYIAWPSIGTSRLYWKPFFIIAVGLAIMSWSADFASYNMNHLIALR